MEDRQKRREAVKALLFEWLRRVVERETTSDAEIAVLPEVAKILIILLKLFDWNR